MSPAALRWMSMIIRAMTDMWDEKRKKLQVEATYSLQISLDRETEVGEKGHGQWKMLSYINRV